MRTAAILPVKSFSRAKQRLGEVVGNERRAELAAAMVSDVLAALAEVPEIDEVVVVTAQPFEADGVMLVHDPEESGQSAAAARGIAAAHGADRVLLVPGDCPALDPGEVRALLAARADVVIVPDRHGTGTNALLLHPPTVMPPAFGPGSCARHATLARAAGATFEVRDLPSLCLDVDTPDDLAALRAALEGRDAAPRTRAVLDRLVARV